MRLGMMQPYFFPYLGYFSLIDDVDVFVLFDRAQFIRHGWVDRNRILKPSGDDWQYIRVPLRASARETIIGEKQIDDHQPWRNRLLAQVEHYRRRAPHYEVVRDLLVEVLTPDHRTIADVDRAGITRVCAHLGITTEIVEFSALEVVVPEDPDPGDWALATCRALPDIDAYCNPIGGRDLFDPARYAAGGVALEFLESDLPPYDQLGSPFLAGLSIIDVMMFNSVDEIRSMLLRRRVVPA
ncbi:MAG: WbqC family protein [Actinomycetota bacterium]